MGLGRRLGICGQQLHATPTVKLDMDTTSA